MAFASNFTKAVKGSNRMLLIVVTAIVGAFGMYYFSGGEQEVPNTVLPPVTAAGPTVHGKNPISQEMDKQLAIADGQRHEESKKTGEFAMPTLRAQPDELKPLPEEGRAREADLSPLPRPEPPVIMQPPVAAPIIPPAPRPIQVAENTAPDPAVEAMKVHIGEIAKAPVYAPAAVAYYYQNKDVIAESTTQAAAPAAVGMVDPASGIKLPLPGTILYAEMISEANSDAPGPILAQIVQGELAGARLIGTFEPQRNTLVIKFSSLTLGTTRDGDEVNASVPMNAYAVDSRTVGTGLATSVDYHLLQNVGLSFATAFAQGFGQAIASSGQQIISGGAGSYLVSNPALTTRQQLYVAGGAAAGAAGQSLNTLFGNRPPTIKVGAGTAIGVLFLPNSGR